ncbi:MAG: hypothetical protein N2Z63_05535 [Thiobacillaceae bacterium]|nr:hypothetical protein [Thiobacillaceae bacterium]
MDWLRTLKWMLRGHAWHWLLALVWAIGVYLFVPLTAEPAATLGPLALGVR